MTLRKTSAFIGRAFSSKVVVLSVVLIGSLSIVSILGWRLSAPDDSVTPTSRATPEYQTVLPPGKAIDQLGGWRRVSPPKSVPVFAYGDTIDGIRVSVSQQPLPDGFMENTEQRIKDLAQGFSATTELTLDSGDKLYIGTNYRGPQSAIVIKNGLLILIKSEAKIKDSAWKSYAESLK